MQKVQTFVFTILILLVSSNTVLLAEVFKDKGVSGFVAGGNEKNTADGVVTREATVEGGARGFVEAIALEGDGGIAILWETRLALAGFGGSSIAKGARGFGGGEIRASGDIGITVMGILPINQAIEDTYLRITNEGVEGKTLIGTSHVLPLSSWMKMKHQWFYFSLTHGFRYHSGLEDGRTHSGWGWAVQPKLRFVDSSTLRCELRYLFSFSKSGRREHSGAVAMEVPVGASLLIRLFAQPEYLKKSPPGQHQFGWRGMIDLSWHRQGTVSSSLF